MIHKRVGILTGGGDCPGLNAVIRSVVRKGIDDYKYEFLGILQGWKGMIEGKTRSLGLNDISGILHSGGTILGTSRTNPSKSAEDMETVITNYRRMGLNALIAIGGDDTLGVAAKMSQNGLNVVGVPKTIDNDLSGTDQTFGFDTAVSVATEAIDRLHSTAESHQRVMVVEVMGRHAGWIAAHAGIASGADIVLVPEFKFSLDDIVKVLDKRKKRGRVATIIVVAEGFSLPDSDLITQDETVDAFGHKKLGGIGNLLGEMIENKTGLETRVSVLGHIQRGGTPTAFDRILATRFGIKAIELVHADIYGNMVALIGSKIEAVDLQQAAQKNRLLNEEIYNIAKVFFG
ncbi:MAG: hypothetical protein ACD_62C00269G0005 [uncultured bacterium]|nr:MAG: hypothetical protein ACD_62C00269G0005 [uncultured bacterium]HLD45390.1 6-phosphofructokinase [bacterium]